MDPTCAALLAGAKDDPDGPGRLVLADWLTENDQDDRAELIRVQYRLAELDPFDPGRAALLERETQLLAAHVPEWLGWLAAPPWSGSFRRGLLHLSCQHPRECAASPGTPHFERCAQWLEAVELRNNSDGDAFQQFLAHPALGRATAWDLSHPAMRPEHFRALVEAPFPNGIVTLGLRGREFTVSTLKRLAAAPWFPRLKHLDLGGGAAMDAKQVAALLAGHTGHLRSLNIGQRELEPDSATALAAAPGVESLERLVLSYNPLGAAGARLLAAGNFAGLRRLELNNNGIGDSGLAALLAAPWLAGLTHLELAGNSLTENAARLLAESPSVRNLAHLELASNLIGDDGLGALVRSPNLAGLTTLRVRANGITDAGVRVLIESGALTRLRVLDLGYNRVGTRGGRALAGAVPEQLFHLAMYANPLGTRSRGLLKDALGSRVAF